MVVLVEQDGPAGYLWLGLVHEVVHVLLHVPVGDRAIERDLDKLEESGYT